MKLSRTVLQSALSVAVNSPSGDNSQPWRFAIDPDGALLLRHTPGADATLYDFREQGSYLAHGALIENISIALGAEGYATAVELFPGGPNVVARLSFAPSAGRDEDLAEAIPARTTNRKPYETRPLEPAHREALLNSFQHDGVKLALLEHPDEVGALARSVSANERLVMSHRGLHDGLFGMIRWSREEERERPGLYVQTMELPPPVEFMFRHVICHWPALRLLNAIGFARMVSSQTAPVYAASSAFGAIIIATEEDEVFIRAGRAFERLWLTATKLGLSIQPTTALPYLAERLKKGEGGMFSASQRALISRANETISRIAGLADPERIAMLFRVGYDGSPSAVSYKRPPIIDML